MKILTSPEYMSSVLTMAGMSITQNKTQILKMGA